MDAKLWELLKADPDRDDQEIEAIIRLGDRDVGAPGVRIVSRFGQIATCRLAPRSIRPARRDDNVLSLKASRPLGPEYGQVDQAPLTLPPRPLATDGRRPADCALTGAGVVVGLVDWGCDFDHPNFKRADGCTRLHALWDQRASGPASAPDPYGYGRVFGARQIDEALGTADPYDALGYHPGEADRDCSGAHGTHCLDIAAGNGLAGGPVGLAPEADLAFVHLTDRGTGGLANLGDSARLLEAVDFIARIAGRRPWVINLSVGRHGGPHDGCTLTELALDHLLGAAPDRCVVHSAGNYFDKSIHATGRLQPGESRSLTLITQQGDLTPNELEVWYSGTDEFRVMLESPRGARSKWLVLGAQADIVEGGQLVGRVYHRARDPNNGDNHVELFLYPWAPSGRWTVTLQALTARGGVFHAWIERDEACPECQAVFEAPDADSSCTIGTIANSRLPLVVGAYDAHSPLQAPAPFSSAGPTRDDRPKPDLLAPGVQVLAARSAPGASSASPGAVTRKSGTSMAAPHVTGAVALCLQGSGRPLGIAEIRALLLGTARRDFVSETQTRGPSCGRLDVAKLVSAVCASGPSATPRPRSLGPTAAKRRDNHERGPGMTPDFDDAEQTFLDPETVYRAIAYAPDGSIPAWIDDTHTVVARPGEAPLTPPAVGDVLIRVALGQRGLGRTSILLESAAGAPVVLDDALVAVERGGPGAYALVVDSGEAGGTGPGPRPIERRLLDPEGHMPRGQLLLRAKREASSDPDEMFAEDDKYEQLLAHLRRELSLSFTDPNDPGLLDRRRRLRAIFAEVPPQRTRELHQRLGARPTADELSRAFHGRLATPTRAELLKILQDRFPAVAPATAPPPPASPPLPDTSKPLPADAERRYRTALAALEQKVAASTDPRVWRYRCWLSKLKAGGDDRVIKWHRICPRTSGALGAAYIVGPCDITAGSAVDQAQLQRSIHSVADVEVANRQLGFITHLRSHILFTHELTSMHLENLRMLHDQVIETVDKLGNWANNPMGGSSAMPAAYVAIKDWIGARQRDPNSVYSCL